jgi:hypothetical protein
MIRTTNAMPLTVENGIVILPSFEQTASAEWTDTGSIKALHIYPHHIASFPFPFLYRLPFSS